MGRFASTTTTSHGWTVDVCPFALGISTSGPRSAWFAPEGLSPSVGIHPREVGFDCVARVQFVLEDAPIEQQLNMRAPCPQSCPTPIAKSNMDVFFRHPCLIGCEGTPRENQLFFFRGGGPYVDTSRPPQFAAGDREGEAACCRAAYGEERGGTDERLILGRWKDV